MKKMIKALSLLGIACMMLIGACAPAAVPAPTDAPPTAVPSATSLPTQTPPPPTETSVPTATFTSTPRPILPTLTSEPFIRTNGSVYAIGDLMYVVFGRFDETPVLQNNLLVGKFYIEGDPANVPVPAMIPGQLSVGKYEGSFAGNSSWTSGTGEELSALIAAGDLLEMRIPIGFLPDNDRILAGLVEGDWSALTTNSLYLNPAMVGVVVK